MPKILLVDDEVEGLELRRMILERHGHTVQVATSPVEARRSMVNDPADCVVTDLRLPELTDGLALIRVLRDQFPAVPIVVLSGVAADLTSCPERLLVDEVLTKPVRSEKLLAAVKVRHVD